MTRRERVLELLEAQEWVTTAELLQGGCGSRYGARILELRAAGHNIEAERVRDGSWRYRLLKRQASSGSAVLPRSFAPGPAVIYDARVNPPLYWYEANYQFGAS